MSDWRILVERVSHGEPEATAELYERLRGFQLRSKTALGDDEAQDAYHDLIVLLVEQLRRRYLRDPERLIAYAAGILRNLLAQRLRERCRRVEFAQDLRDPASDPERLLLTAESERTRARLAASLLGRIRPIDREILAGLRPPSLNAAQYANHKSRAKRRLAALFRAIERAA